MAVFLVTALSTISKKPHDAANRWPLRAQAFDDFDISVAARLALASGR